MKITIVGGGSYCWTPILFRDIIQTPELEGAEIVLEDINPKHLRDLLRCCRAILKQTRKTGKFKIKATTNEREALKDADYVILTITTGGFDAMEHDLAIPYKYGIWQPVGDTIGPGGLSRALRNIPAVVGIARTMERVCPNAWMLNITNPLSTLTRAVWRETGIRCIGLCHELYGALAFLERLLGAADWRTDFDCKSVGVNHLPWIIELRYDGRDAFPLIRRKLREIRRAKRAPDRGGKIGTALDHTLVDSHQVKSMLFDVFGAFPAAGDRHLVEFFPFFTTEATAKGADFGVKLTTIEDRRRKWMPRWQQNVRDINAGRKKIDLTVSKEAVVKIIGALAGGAQWKDVLNLPNRGQVRELPPEVIVETLGFVERDQAHGLPIGTVPPAVLTQLQRHVTNQELTVEAAVSGDRALALQVLFNDPLCGTLRDPRHLKKMLDELLRANRQWLPLFFNKRKGSGRR